MDDDDAPSNGKLIQAAKAFLVLDEGLKALDTEILETQEALDGLEPGSEEEILTETKIRKKRLSLDMEQLEKRRRRFICFMDQLFDMPKAQVRIEANDYVPVEVVDEEKPEEKTKPKRKR